LASEEERDFSVKLFPFLLQSRVSKKIKNKMQVF